jgi:hypothetical protein
MRAVYPIFALFALTCVSATASAQLYKWVDERGITNYSNDPPPPAATAHKLSRVENKISVYTPDDSFMQAVKAVRERSLKALAEPEPVRSPVARIEAQPSGYEQCVASGRIGCDDLYPGYYPAAYLPAAYYPYRRVQPTRFLPPRPAPRDPTRISRSPLR